MKKSAQVVMLPTNEIAIIGFLTQKGKERCHLVHFDTPMPNILDSENQHLYFLSDEEIKEGDWVCKGTEIWQVKSYYGFQPITKKIIATTDKSLKQEIFGLGETAMCSLPQIPQSFIEHFVKEYNKGNVITDVMVEYENIDMDFDPTEQNGIKWQTILKINSDNTIDISMPKDSWSREEVVELLYKHTEYMLSGKKDTLDKWIEENL